MKLDNPLKSKHAETKWQATAWKLEGKYPGRWGRNMKHKIEPITKSESEVKDSDEDLKDV